jgi:cyclohexanone monooxygenase
MGASEQSEQLFDAVIVGAGFAGVYALHRLRRQGLTAVVVDAANGVGGTWYWNRYPGARCDVESMQYSYSFSDEIQQEWNWTELYASQPEILRYINFVVDRLKLRDGIVLDTRVKSARFDEGRSRWSIATDRDEAYLAKYFVMATGCLSIPISPEIPGLDRFEKRILRTSEWPDEPVKFDGLSVGLVGTGSSGIQITPQIARTARELHVFQRTPNYSIPARNRPLDDRYRDIWKQNYRERRNLALNTKNNTINNAGLRSGFELTPEQFEAELESRWASGGIGFMYAFTDISTNDEINERVSTFVRKKIGQLVEDPATADKLTPKSYPIGAKRICVDTDYFTTFNRENVFLEDVKADPIETMTASGVRLKSGREVPLDMLVLATGFDAMTGALMRVRIEGREGVRLQDVWESGPRTYLGLMVSGFPNMFIVAGPQSPSVFTNMVTSIEQHVDWIADAVARIETDGLATIDAEPEAEDRWVRHVNELAERALVGKGDSNSWYAGANVPGKPRVVTPYLGGAVKYMERLNASVENDYSGFSFK